MTAKEILQKVKAVFEGTTVVAKFASFPIDNGQPIYVDTSDDGLNDIDTGDSVYSDDAMTLPYPDGTYTVTGTSFSFTVAGGTVTAIDGSLTASAEPAADPLAVDATKYDAMQKEIDALKAQHQRITETLNKMNILLEKHEKTIPGFFELVEKLIEGPQADPVTLNERQKEKFNHREAKEKRIASFATALNDLRKK